MLRILVPLAAALALANPVQAQTQPEPTIDAAGEMFCVANLLLFRVAATKMLENPAEQGEKRAATERLLANTNEALSWYIGRLSMQPAGTDLQAMYVDAVGKSATAKREDQVKHTFDCLTGATKARIAAAQRLLPER